MNNKINYNEKYILIVNKKKDYDNYKYSFLNILLLKNDSKSLRNTSKYIKENNFKQIIFLNHENIFVQLINSFEKEYIIKFIYTKDLGTFSNQENYEMFSKIFEMYEEKIVDEIGFIDKYLYDSFKDKIKCSHIMIDIPITNKLVMHNDTITIINDPNNLYHSYYNELSAITLTDKILKIKEKNKTFKKFIKLFKIKNKDDRKSYEESLINLYINFSDTDVLKVLEYMDKESICILGNTSLFDQNKYLKEKLVMNSDDDINEIKKRIEDVVKNKNRIIEEYQRFRKEYSNNSKKSILSFIEEKEERKKEKYDYLISVIVPVYNSELFLEKTIESILKAKIKDMEILIINDGSTDNSEEIILKYKNKYPKLIKYFKQKNQGLGSVRNFGLKNAKGKYIASIDSDDQIDKNFFANALKYLKDDVDMVIYDWKTYEEDKSYITNCSDYIFKNKSLYESILFTTIMPSQCNKIIKKSIYEDMKLTYGTGKYEDFVTNSIALLNVKTFKYINKPSYKYFIRKGSIMRSEPKYDMINAIKLLDDRLEEYKSYLTVDKDEYKYYLYSWRIEEYIINVLYDLDEINRNKMIDYMLKKIKDILIYIFDSSYYQKMLNNQDNDIKEYINERNKSLKNDKFKTFISKKIKDKSYQKLTGVLMLYNKK